MPSNSKTYFLKLASGYNIGIDKRNVKSIKTIGKSVSKKSSIKIKQKTSLPKISILHTGGTIASKVDYKTGGVVAQFKPEEILAMFPKLKDIGNFESRLISNIMSENMNFFHYNLLAKEIAKEVKKGVKGVIITHGTDTLHYTSAALSFILEGLSVPVVLVGAQRSSDRGSSDAEINLVSAAMFISNFKSGGVFVCMHENADDDTNVILNGLKVRKMHTTRRDAFKPINEFPIAKIDYKKKKVQILRKVGSSGKLSLKLFNPKIKVGLIKTVPNMNASEFLNFKNYAGLLIEGMGIGHAPIIKFDEFTSENEKMRKALVLLGKNTILALASQTIYGRINMNVYSPGRELQEIGVLGNFSDMTAETSFIKLGWLLSNYPKKVKEMFCEDLRGEISKRSSEEFELF